LAALFKSGAYVAGFLKLHLSKACVCLHPQGHSCEWTLQVLIALVNLCNSSMLAKLIKMMGMALATKCVIGNLSKRLRKAGIVAHFSVEGILAAVH